VIRQSETVIPGDLVFDHLAANLMLADADLTIVYVNPAVQQMLRRIETDIRRDLPEFDVNSLVGRNIDVFHRHPSHQRRMLAGLEGRSEAQIIVGGRVLRVLIAALDDRTGSRLGYSVE
jgi:methyl-accepting chemotaxis protein